MEDPVILIALADEAEARTFAGYLGKAGFETVVAGDGAAALELAIQTPPSMVITTPELEVIGGERVFQILRHNPHTSAVPFLFVSDSVTDIRHFRTGVDVFLVRPLNLEELRGRIARSITRPEAPGSDSRSMEGRIDHMSVADVLQFLQLNSKEGELRVTSNGRVGTIYVKQGEVYNSVAEGSEREKALFRILSWEEGKFEFIPRQISISRKVKASTGNLLMEGMRQIDEYRKHRDEFPGPSAVIRQAGEGGDPPDDIPPAGRELLRLVETHSTAADLVDASSYPDYQAYQALSSLMARGVVKEEKPDDEGAALSDEFLTNDQAISIREKILTRFSDFSGVVGFSRMMILSTSPALVGGFARLMKGIKGVTTVSDVAGPAPVGEVATYRLYGGMDLVFFAVPTVKDMAPMWKAFDSNLVGLVLLWDDKGAKDLKALASAKREVLLGNRVPTAHVFMGDKPGDDDSAFYRKALGLRSDEPVFSSASGVVAVEEALYSIFGKLLKEDHAAV